MKYQLKTIEAPLCSYDMISAIRSMRPSEAIVQEVITQVITQVIIQVIIQEVATQSTKRRWYTSLLQAPAI